MKTLIIALLMSITLTVSADGSISLFSGTKSGVIADYGAENIRIEFIGTGNPVLGASLKGAFDVGGDKLWFGVGYWEHEATTTDTSDDWYITTLETEEYVPAIFVEYAHSSGWFVRASHYEGETTANFKGLDIVSAFPDIQYIPKGKVVTTKFSEELYFVGYKLEF